MIFGKNLMKRLLKSKGGQFSKPTFFFLPLCGKTYRSQRESDVAVVLVMTDLKTLLLSMFSVSVITENGSFMILARCHIILEVLWHRRNIIPWSPTHTLTLTHTESPKYTHTSTSSYGRFMCHSWSVSGICLSQLSIDTNCCSPVSVLGNSKCPRALHTPHRHRCGVNSTCSHQTSPPICQYNVADTCSSRRR